MIPISRSVRGPSALFVTVAAAVLACAASVRADDGHRDKCNDYSGPFTSTTVPVPPCTSPVGLCTHGILHGDLPGTYDFTFATLQPAGDPTDPTEYVYTGHSIVTTSAGVMYTNDNGVIHIPTTGGPAPFATTAIVDHGSAAYAHATGVFVAQGNLDFSTGQAVGSFIAHICNAGACGDHDGDHGHH